ncbi:hypothetical protein BCR39DRAFT_5926 [Naematelia encephala]|uniref:Uncharacterized protein n=1 Tax=Naematelia encephala TaxID=71784 RepID=A0A1Y2BKV7_9TREE|nr:hypothetical protein BCR39DRAFT_5926 [Naematelia encephala]
MTETLASFPRPTSLLVPDRSFVTPTPILDTSSYSPFPTFPGSTHTRDPYGLNAYLLHPEDLLWSYVDPTPATLSSDKPEERSSNLVKRPSLLKQRSMSNLRQPSPLATQQPLEPEEEVQRSPSLRRRSNSLDSQPSSPRLGTPFEDTQPEVATKTPKSPGKSLRKVMHRARRNFFASSENLAAFDLPPPVPSFARTSFEDGDPSTPMSSRSVSNISEVSSRSSTGSSEGIKTPQEGLQVDVGIAGLNLADALLEAEGNNTKVKSWRGWLGSKKSKSAFNFKSGSHALATFSPVSSPNASAINLTAIGKDFSVDEALIKRSASDISLTLSRPANPFAAEQLRRVSHHKMGQLRSPSPHPLAMHLRRQHFNFPDDVAFSIQAGQKVFPLSVNLLQRAGPNMLNPSNGGLRLTIGIKSIINRLDRGHYPIESLSTRPANQRAGTLPRPRGILDFIDRPPYEERNIVFFPNGTLSPISMARPGYGVWDLDFSQYIVALSRVDEPTTTSAYWAKMPRVSVSDSLNELEKVAQSFEANNEVELETPEDSPDIEKEILISPPSEMVESSEILEPEEPNVQSSFRPLKNVVTEYSSDEESSEEDDDEPLAVVIKKKSMSSFSTSRPIAFQVPVAKHAQAQGYSDARTSRQQENEEAKRRRAMEEVVRARERRQAAISGELERGAAANQRRSDQNNRASFISLDRSRHSRAPSSSSSRPPSVHVSPASPPTQARPTERRRRVQSTYDTLRPPLRPATSRHTSAPGPEVGERRYHSFYETSNGASMPMTMYTHPAMRAFQVPRPASMMVPQQMGMYAYPSMNMSGSRMSLAVPPAARVSGRRQHIA